MPPESIDPSDLDEEEIDALLVAFMKDHVEGGRSTVYRDFYSSTTSTEVEVSWAALDRLLEKGLLTGSVLTVAGAAVVDRFIERQMRKEFVFRHFMERGR